MITNMVGKLEFEDDDFKLVRFHISSKSGIKIDAGDLAGKKGKCNLFFVVDGNLCRVSFSIEEYKLTGLLPTEAEILPSGESRNICTGSDTSDDDVAAMRRQRSLEDNGCL